LKELNKARKRAGKRPADGGLAGHSAASCGIATEDCPAAEDACQSAPVADRRLPAIAPVPPAGAGSPGRAEPLSLNDIAALLVRCDQTNPADLQRLQDVLWVSARDISLSVGVRSLLDTAARHMDEVASGDATDPSMVLSEVGQLVENAIEESEPDRPVANAGDKTGAAPPPATHQEAITKPGAGTIAAQPETERLPDDTDAGLMGEFITEGREYIEGSEAALLSLETNPDDMEAVNTVFRAFHTIKGTSAFLGLVSLSELAHRAESLLGRVRDRQIRFAGGYADLALRGVDMLKALLQAVQDALGGEPLRKPQGYDELFSLLENPEAAGVSSESTVQPVTPPRIGDILVAEGRATRAEIEAAAADQGDQPIGVAIVRSQSASLTDVAHALRAQQQIVSPDRGMESSVRVRTDRLDRLIDMVGELVIAQSMVTQDSTVVSGGHHDLLKKVGHTGKIVRELQGLGMSMRMIPFKGMFQKMTRLARDLAHKNGKQVDLVTEGEDTEIDRNMVDALSDPLVHMVRNALDHAIEPPEVRQQSGKPPTGVLRLSAYHAGGNVVVELSDDGRGLDRDKIVKKAIATGLIESDKGMSDRDIFNLIFRPGFSTVEKVTEVSGRGVGMDVVKRGIDALRGRIEISSEPGRGCKFTLRLPFTMAVTDGMLIRVGDQRYIIPTINIHLSFRPTADSLSTVGGRGELVMLRGEVMPIFRLHRLFEIHGAIEDVTLGILVVVGDGGRRCALLVDELLGQQQVVAKSLGDGIGEVAGVSGGAILGDGRVGLILDTTGITAMARQVTSTGDMADARCHSTA